MFKLSGDLIQSIVELQEQVADATDPIASLDRTQPGWRDTLPLPVEDATVEALLRNLVGQARTLTQTERQRWRWRCRSVRQGEGWSIAQHLELPSSVTAASLHTWSGWDDPPARLRVLLHTTEGIDVIALLTRLQGTGEQAVYRCEEVRRGGVRLLGNAAMAGAQLLLSRGDVEVELPMVGGHELGPLPWVFAERGGQWEWVGEGSVRSRDVPVRMLAPDAGCCLAVEGTCTPLSRAPDLQRLLYEINGTVEWQHPDLGACQIRCASQEASKESFILYGKRLASVFNHHPPFLGMPSLYAMGRDEVSCRIAGATLEWRSLDAPESAWRTDAAACAGQVWIRYRDTGGALRFRRQVEIGRSLRLMLPFPRQGAAFVRAGQVLPAEERVPLGRLAAIQALVHAPTGGSRFYLEGRVRTLTSVSRHQALQEALPTASTVPLHFALHRVQERLASMLAMTDDLDAVVTLEIVDWEGHALADLEVARFDVSLEPDRTHNQVVLPQDSLGRLNDGWQERLTVKMLPLWAPATEPTDLSRDQAANAWQIPEGLEPGPWWVLGMDGDWARFRPLLWMVHGEKALAEASELMQAIHEPVRAMRQTKLQVLVSALTAHAEHPDWPHVFDYLPLTRAYPAGALDLVQHLAHVPEAMILALLRSADEEFDLVWSLAEQLPFSWYLVPVTGWLRAAERHFGALRIGLADYDTDGSMLWGMFWKFRQRVTSRQPFFQSVCDWVGEWLFPDRQMQNNVLAMARRATSFLTAQIQQRELELQARHGADDRYPDGPLVMERTRPPDFPEQFRYDRFSYPYRPVRCAPFVAAQISLHSEASSEEFLFELRQLRDFDPEWFDNAFALALCLGLARRPAAAKGTHS